MSETKNIKVLGAGSPMLDILVFVDDSFIDGIEGAKGGMELVAPETLNSILAKTSEVPKKALGGSAANTIFGLQQLGTPTALLGKVGKDDEGAFYTTSYKKIGGDDSCFKVNTDVPTGRCLSLVTPDSQRTMRTDLGAAATLCPGDVVSSDFEGKTHVHMEGYLLFNGPLAEHILKLAKESDCTVSLDMASFEVVNAGKATLPDLIKKYVDILFANEDEAAAFCGHKDPRKALDELSGYCETVVVKVGKEGAFIKRGEEVVKAEAGPAKAIDTTGAGDLWQAGFLYGYLNGETLTECGRYASILGDEVVQVMGAEIPAERWEAIKSQVG